MVVPARNNVLKTMESAVLMLLVLEADAMSMWLWVRHQQTRVEA
jgi:hypothetical protein